MKSKFHLILICCSLFILTACPIITNHPVIEKGEECFSENLIGTWTNNGKSYDAKQVTIQNSLERNVALLHIDETPDGNDPLASDYWCWLAAIEGEFYLSMLDTFTSTVEKKYYTYHLQIENSNTVVCSDIYLSSLPADTKIQSSKEFKKAVRDSRANTDFLTDPITWTKD